MQVNCREGEVFCNPLIRSQSYMKPLSLGCDLLRCFLVSALQMRQEGWREPELGISLPPGHLGSGKMVPMRAGFVTENKMIWAYL